MKPKFHAILELAIENGVRKGYYRAHKYAEAPSEDEIINSIEEHVMSSIYEFFKFDDEI